MQERLFKQVDVFTAMPYRGNPLAVVLDGSGLSSEEMQRFTDWTHLSEATFLLPPTNAQADYRVRIFCPGRELPFAGHPTLGSCHAWLEAGGTPRASGAAGGTPRASGAAGGTPRASGLIVQECGVGLVNLRRDGDRLAFAAPPLRQSGPLPEEIVALIARGLGIERSAILRHAWCDNGPRWRSVMLGSADEVLALKPDAAVLAGLEVGVVGPWGPGGECAFEVRAFFPGHNGLAEDPVTGSLNAALAQWLIGSGLAPEHYVVSQGTALGRSGRVHVQRDAAQQVWIGGASVTCIDGAVKL